ncbi:exosortase/archaeosortase family protein [Myxococcota bacterium]|nr:exosortase/archaeosortase family protein [Myxococcota bacterium]MBU1430789.1 exosortase/archaeosortase family protein [Myxococcota bacterium]MBU1897343.1 exosortase/archaeosortase family protein [Myxococcota bacterium]
MRPPPAPWPPWLTALFGGLAALAALPALVWTFDIWWSGLLGGAAAGLLTIPLCLMLVYLAARRPAWRATSPNRAGAEALFAGGVLALLLTLLLAHGDADRLIWAGATLPLITWAWLWGGWGLARARALTLPVGFALFSLPWEHLLRGQFDVFLQEWSADIAVQALRVLGYEVTYWNAFTFYSPKFYVIVNETCSGMNMLVTLAMYTVIYAWLTQPLTRNRLLLLLLVAPISLFFNGLRVMIIYLMGHYGGEPLAMGFWHTGSAYILFLPVFYLIYAINELLRARFTGASARADR